MVLKPWMIFYGLITLSFIPLGLWMAHIRRPVKVMTQEEKTKTIGCGNQALIIFLVCAAIALVIVLLPPIMQGG